MTSPSSRRADVVQGSQQAAIDLEPSSGVGPASQLNESAPLICGLCAATSNSALCRPRCPAPGCMPGMCSGSGGERAGPRRGIARQLVTNAVKASAGYDLAAVRLRLSDDRTRVLIEVWDADPRPPAPNDPANAEHPTLRKREGAGCSWWQR
jgi:hypothetical protein